MGKKKKGRPPQPPPVLAPEEPPEVGTVGLVLADSASNANKVVPGALTLTSTFKCISVTAAFSGDANQNATATLRYRVAAGSWKTAYTPYVDRRTTVTVGGSPVSNSANVNQARGSIVGLTANTSYEVELTWVDSDGVIGSAIVSGTVSTLSLTATAGGGTYYVDGDQAVEGDGSTGNPFKTITHAISVTAAGDTLKVRNSASPYAAFTISASGTDGAYRILENDTGHTPVIAAGAANCIIVTGDYWRITGFTLNASPENGVKIGTGGVAQHHVFVTNCTCTNMATSAVFGTGAVFITEVSHHIFILNNTFARSAALPGLEVDPVWINGGGCHTVVIDGNTISGNWWDAIGNGANSNLTTMTNSDYANNIITGLEDDTIELDGGSIHLRCWGNSATVAINAALSEAGVIVGPCYIFRNLLINTKNGGVGIKGGTNSVGPVKVFHNTIITAASGANEVVGFADRLHEYKNNIFQASGNIYYFGQDENTYDYNLGYVTNGADWAYQWNGTTNYATFAAFQAGTLQEAHGLAGDPLFINAAKEIDNTSPAYNTGVVIPNFNDADSAWPYQGAAPDMGYFEVP